MTKEQRNLIENLIKNDMARETDGQAMVFHQTGYNWITDQISFYVHPAEYTEIIATMDFLSN